MLLTTAFFPRRLPGMILLLGALLSLGGCDGTSVQLVAEAGLDAAKAVTLSDEAVHDFSQKVAGQQDREHRIAPPDNPHTRRLERLVGPHREHNGLRFNFRVYLDPTVNAFAMADGSIRIYS
ncbi:MAG TPA: hypothetical protein VLL73_04930, partial [Desulfurivibrionaceae bacterium]|nr:hypothetical protein [Desulfurivibrionaceae bacterium]